MSSVGCVTCRRSLRDSHVLVCRPVVKEKPALLLYHSFDEDYIWYLTNLFPFCFGKKDGRLRPREQFARIASVEDGDSSAIHKMIVGAVIDQHNAA